MKQLWRLIPVVFALYACAASEAAGGQTAAAVIRPYGPFTRPTRSRINLSVTSPKNETGRYVLWKVAKNGKTDNIPENMTFGVPSGEFAWEPTESQVGTYEINFAPLDGDVADSIASVKITVTPRAVYSGNNRGVRELLTRWYAEGTAAGNTGDFYDNRDNGHSSLNTSYYFPQLDRITYTKETLKLYGWGPQRRLLERVVFGNSSTSSHPTRSGSNARFYYRSSAGLAFLHEQYRQNNLYVYPEHRDYDPGRNGRGGGYGDVYPTNTPYLIISQGSSGSDQAFLQVIAPTMAAFRPAVKARLIEEGLLMPALQMIFRMSNKNVQKEKIYLSQEAHPTVFAGSNVDALKMVQMAHRMRLNDIPPMIQLKVLDEDRNRVGKDFFEPSPSATEHLADTPAVIARVVRGPQYVRTMVVSAEESFDLNKKKLTYHWVVLRGDRERIKIVPQNRSRSVVELQIPYHARYPIRAGDKLESNRVDIGAFVHNGSYYSAPGFVTFFTIAREDRSYAKDGRLLEIDYRAGSTVIDHAALTDWTAFLQTILDTDESLATRLLRERLEPGELARLRKIASEHQPLHDRMRSSAKEHKDALAEVRSLQNAVRAATKARTAAERAYGTDRSDANRRALEEAKRQHQQATIAYDRTRKALPKLRRAADKARTAADQFLRNTKIDRTSPVADRLLDALNAIKNDVTLYIKHVKRIDALADSHSKRPGRSSVKSLIKELRELGVVTETADGLRLNPLRAGNGPARKRLTDCERHRLQRVHLEILNQLLFAEFLDQPYSENFCDNFITAAKPWRDVYHYARDGTCLGWTRFIAGRQVEFNADGYMILEKDALGRATKARTTMYKGKRADPGGRWELEFLAGDEIVEYAYKAAGDSIGTVSGKKKVRPY